MGIPKLEPLVKLIFRDVESFTKLFNGRDFEEVFTKNSENKEKSVPSIRNDDIWKDGVGMITAETLNSHDAETVGMWMTVNEVSNASVVVGVKFAVTGTLTDWAGFEFEIETSHIGIKKRF